MSSLVASSLHKDTIYPDFSSLSAGSLKVKLADTEEEVQASQRLRYTVFYEELGAKGNPKILHEKRDFDEYDDLCDHILVIDTESNNKVVGTYRVLLSETARRAGVPMYTETEFDLSGLHGEDKIIMETSRSCVLEAYRNKMIVNLLWQAISQYAIANGVTYLVGVPSFHGTDPEEYAEALAYLYENHQADPALNLCARKDLAGTLESASYPKKKCSLSSAREITAALPPLVKGYIRLGAKVSQNLVIDRQFNTVDVCIIVDAQDQQNDYVSYYHRKAEKNEG